MPKFEDLKASRKPDRQIISGHFLRVAHQYGAKIEAKEAEAQPGYHGPSIELRGGLNGVAFMLDIDDLHERHGHKGSLISWYNDWPRASERPLDFAAAFNSAVKDYGQHRPHHKASSSGSWSELLAAFEGGLRLAWQGEAFREQERIQI